MGNSTDITELKEEGNSTGLSLNYSILKLNSNNKTYKKNIYKVFKNIWLVWIRTIKNVRKITLQIMSAKRKVGYV